MSKIIHGVSSRAQKERFFDLILSVGVDIMDIQYMVCYPFLGDDFFSHWSTDWNKIKNLLKILESSFESQNVSIFLILKTD